MTHPDHLTIIGGLIVAEDRLKAARRRMKRLRVMIENQYELGSVTDADLESARDAALERVPPNHRGSALKAGGTDGK